MANKDTAREPETQPTPADPIVTNTYRAPAKTPVWDVATQGQPPEGRGDYEVIDSSTPDTDTDSEPEEQRDTMEPSHRSAEGE